MVVVLHQIAMDRLEDIILEGAAIASFRLAADRVELRPSQLAPDFTLHEPFGCEGQSGRLVRRGRLFRGPRRGELRVGDLSSRQRRIAAA